MRQPTFVLLSYRLTGARALHISVYDGCACVEPLARQKLIAQKKRTTCYTQERYKMRGNSVRREKQTWNPVSPLSLSRSTLVCERPSRSNMTDESGAIKLAQYHIAIYDAHRLCLLWFLVLLLCFWLRRGFSAIFFDKENILICQYNINLQFTLGSNLDPLNNECSWKNCIQIWKLTQRYAEKKTQV